MRECPHCFQWCNVFEILAVANSLSPAPPPPTHPHHPVADVRPTAVVVVVMVGFMIAELAIWVGGKYSVAPEGDVCPSIPLNTSTGGVTHFAFQKVSHACILGLCSLLPGPSPAAEALHDVRVLGGGAHDDLLALRLSSSSSPFPFPLVLPGSVESLALAVQW